LKILLILKKKPTTERHLSNSQMGFRKRRGISAHDHSKSASQYKSSCLFCGQKKAFDRINHEKLLINE